MKSMTFTLSEILRNCYDWEGFCDEKGWNVYAVNEGGGDIEVELSMAEIKKFGLLNFALEE